MSSPRSITLPQVDSPAWQRELLSLDVGEIRLGQHDRTLYATDASLYQAQPLGVILPTNAQQAQRLVQFCHDQKLPLLPRGGGTSLAGQCATEAIVLDLSAGCRELLSIDAIQCRCEVDPGISVDELNRRLAASHLFFAPDPATSAQAAIGGVIGNNAAGSRSIRYGRTSENVAAIDVILGSGETTRLEAGAGRRCAIALRLAQQVAAITRQHADAIRERFPKTIRRNAGYGLDLILQQIDRGVADDDLDLTGLVCGSEGTLVVVTGATLKLHPVPLGRGLAIAAFDSVDAAMDAVSPLLATKPSAVELLDDVVLKCARGNAVCSAYVDYLPRVNGRDPAAVLYVEYQAEQSHDEIEAGFAALRRVLPTAAIEIYRDNDSFQKVWTLRKSGEALLHGLSAHRKPLTFVEDNAVPVENLPRFVREFRRIVESHGTSAAFYAHASVGVLHVRPLVDLHDEKDRILMQHVAQEVADLARECGGVMSGEHGDGRARGPLLERFFGTELMLAFAAVKQVFDPHGILNPRDIVNPRGLETITQHLRIDHERPGGTETVDTFYEYADQEDFRGAVEMCNGAGFCRKTAGGTMCPSYRATLDERHSTRGRGNALRAAILGQGASDQDAGPQWDDAETIKTLDLCLSCKACKTECPSNVDVSRLKAEYSAQRYRRGGTPLAARLFGHVRKLNQLGSIAPALANFFSTLEPVRAIMNEVLNLAPRRSLPPFAKSLYAQYRKPPHPATKPRVVLFADCFTTYNEPHIGLAAVRVLQAFGYAVDLPQVGCCGRAMMSTGLLPDAIRSADGVLASLQSAIDDPNVAAVLVCEPSCLSSMVDDWLQLKLQTDPALRKRLAAKAMLVEEFLVERWNTHPAQPPLAGRPRSVVYHGHCHQKALWGAARSADALRKFAADVNVLDSGCCGMAGSFGFTADRYDLSMKIGELSVFPPIRASDADVDIVAPGTSCRHQITDGTGRHALHPIEWIARAMGL